MGGGTFNMKKPCQERRPIYEGNLTIPEKRRPPFQKRVTFSATQGELKPCKKVAIVHRGEKRRFRRGKRNPFALSPKPRTKKLPYCFSHKGLQTAAIHKKHDFLNLGLVLEEVPDPSLERKRGPLASTGHSRGKGAPDNGE